VRRRVCHCCGGSCVDSAALDGAAVGLALATTYGPVTFAVAQLTGWTKTEEAK
jgi:hypothetical protein